MFSKVIGLVCCLVIVIAFPCPALAQKASVDEKPDPKAAKIWEKAIAAKGGRTRLEAVRNLYQQQVWKECKIGCVEDYLFVFPDKIWKIEMTPYGSREPRGDINTWNFDQHLWQKTYRNLDATLAEGSKRPLDTKNDSSYYYWIQDAQFIHLFESKWLKPIPLSARKGWAGLQAVDIVRVRIPNVIDISTKSDTVMDFYLDTNSHLLIETRFVKNGKADKESSVTYSNYIEINGIKLPQKQTPWRPLFADPDTKGSSEYRYQIDVEVDEGIFSRPLNNHMGRYEWRKGK